MTEIAQRELLSVRDLLRYAVTRFNGAGLAFGHGIDNAYDEAAYLILQALHLPLDRLDVFLDCRLLDPERKAILERIERRAVGRIPAAYLTGEAFLLGHRFRVDERVIVPRSFIAELLNESLAPWIADPDAVHSVLDLCTGSGCLAILAALYFPAARVDAVDVSSAALEVAAANIAEYGLEARIAERRSDLFEALRGPPYDLIISNPPYVDARAMRELPEEYRHEPSLALAGGVDGLDLVRRILAEAKDRLTPGGLLVVEIGHHRDVLEAAYPELPFTWLETTAGNEFVFLLHRDDLP